ncbi:MAG: DUF4404 family protein [Pirellulaceae bacterium]|nr:DUF4404 family protein [Planctomycetales bacterium]MCA9206556.1 DUF4404 family protein [Planctomycetales bacterium]MCA9206764.1 DUF4404 family protein [Planctomycetales bacterium]MCA9221623.1 DUF4404 family protein [Planctomycetales bacterium]MCA9224232.1 DUF4404 family protein [Planctomycetales bacterium]
MPERLERLRALVRELEAELERLDEIDPETRDVLREAASEIDDALAEQSPEQLRPRTLTERLTETVESIEASHPTLAAVVNRMADALGQLGI